jgi:hypothetical protein
MTMKELYSECDLADYIPYLDSFIGWLPVPNEVGTTPADCEIDVAMDEVFQIHRAQLHIDEVM